MKAFIAYSIFFVFPFLFPDATQASVRMDLETYIMRVKSGAGLNSVQQSGFFVSVNIEGKKMEGVITALHGIAAFKTDPVALYRRSLIKLTLLYADIEKDTAFLALSNKPDGLKPVEVSSVIPNTKLYLAGFPIGMAVPRVREIDIGSPARQTLGEFGVLDEKTWSERNSPSLNTSVLNIDGNLMPGDSGCLVASIDGKAIAVGNGGFDQGRLDLSWAIVLSELEFRKASEVQQQLASLAALGMPGLKLFGHKASSALPCQVEDVDCWKSWSEQAKVAIEMEEFGRECEKVQDLDQKGQCIFAAQRKKGNKTASCISGLALIKSLNDPLYCSRKGILGGGKCEEAKKELAHAVKSSFHMCNENVFDPDWVKLLNE